MFCSSLRACVFEKDNSISQYVHNDLLRKLFSSISSLPIWCLSTIPTLFHHFICATQGKDGLNTTIYFLEAMNNHHIVKALRKLREEHPQHISKLLGPFEQYPSAIKFLRAFDCYYYEPSCSDFW